MKLLSAVDGEATYPILRSQQRLVQTPILSDNLTLSISNAVDVIVVKGDSLNDLNKAQLKLAFILQFGSETKEVVAAARMDYISTNYSEPVSAKESLDISLPISFVKGQIDFIMRVHLDFALEANLSMTRTDNQLNIEQEVRVIVQGVASYQTPDFGGVIGNVEFKGEVINLQLRQDNIVKLRGGDIKLIGAIDATLFPHKYELLQKFARQACYRRTLLWVKKLVWCNWESSSNHWSSGKQPVSWKTTHENTTTL